MSSPEPWADARVRIETAGLVPADRVCWPNEAFHQPNGETWIAVDMSGGLSEPLELGGGVWQERGRLWMHCFAPTGTGTADLRALAKAAADLFRGLPSGPVVYESAEIGMGEPGDDDGRYWRISVSVEYRYQDR